MIFLVLFITVWGKAQDARFHIEVAYELPNGEVWQFLCCVVVQLQEHFATHFSPLADQQPNLCLLLLLLCK